MRFFKNKSSLILCFIFCAFIGFLAFSHTHLEEKRMTYIWISALYTWAPGIIGLIFAKKEGLKIPIFKSFNRYSYFGFLAAILIALLSFSLTPFFGAVDPRFAQTPAQLQMVPGIFLFFLVPLMFIGGAFSSLLVLYYWVGYLWEHLKSNAFKAVWMIALAWSLWCIPALVLFTFFEPEHSYFIAVVRTVAVNSLLIPILLYYRIRGKALLTPVLFYVFLTMTPAAVAMAFPALLERSASLIYSGTEVCLLVGYSLFLGLYSRSFWNEIK